MPARIEECPRDDVAGWHAKDGMDLWCPCCGRFWKGTAEELALADRPPRAPMQHPLEIVEEILADVTGHGLHTSRTERG